MATAMGIPSSKNIIRRHLCTEFDALVLPARWVNNNHIHIEQRLIRPKIRSKKKKKEFTRMCSCHSHALIHSQNWSSKLHRKNCWKSICMNWINIVSQVLSATWLSLSTGKSFIIIAKVHRTLAIESLNRRQNRHCLRSRTSVRSKRMNQIESYGKYNATDDCQALNWIDIAANYKIINKFRWIFRTSTESRASKEKSNTRKNVCLCNWNDDDTLNLSDYR